MANTSIEKSTKEKYEKLILYKEIKEARKEAHLNFIKIRESFCSESIIY